MAASLLASNTPSSLKRRQSTRRSGAVAKKRNTSNDENPVVANGDPSPVVADHPPAPRTSSNCEEAVFRNLLLENRACVPVGIKRHDQETQKIRTIYLYARVM